MLLEKYQRYYNYRINEQNIQSSKLWSIIHILFSYMYFNFLELLSFISDIIFFRFIFLELYSINLEEKF